MSYWLDKIGNIPQCVVKEDEPVPLRRWLAELDRKSTPEDKSPDYSFREQDFKFAQRQPWGESLKRFQSYNDFSEWVRGQVAKSMSQERCAIDIGPGGNLKMTMAEYHEHDRRDITRIQLQLEAMDPQDWGKKAPYLSEFGERARFESPAQAQQWLAAVRQHSGVADGKPPTELQILRGIRGAMQEFGLTFKSIHTIPGFNEALVEPSEIIRQKVGDCRAGTLLVLATLKEFGYGGGFITTWQHIVPTLISDQPQLENFSGVPLHSMSEQKTVYLYPFESTLFSRDGNLTKAMKMGKDFADKELDGSETVVMETRGQLHQFTAGYIHRLRKMAQLPLIDSYGW